MICTLFTGQTSKEGIFILSGEGNKQLQQRKYKITTKYCIHGLLHIVENTNEKAIGMDEKELISEKKG